RCRRLPRRQHVEAHLFDLDESRLDGEEPVAAFAHVNGQAGSGELVNGCVDGLERPPVVVAAVLAPVRAASFDVEERLVEPLFDMRPDHGYDATTAPPRGS